MGRGRGHGQGEGRGQKGDVSESRMDLQDDEVRINGCCNFIVIIYHINYHNN